MISLYSDGLVSFSISVTEFSKKTGDYQSLSPIDLRVIALTYQLECEHGQEKGANLKTEPLKALNEVQK